MALPPLCGTFGLGAVIVCQFGASFFHLAGQSADLAAGAGLVIAILGWGALGTLLFNTTAFFLEGMPCPLPAMVVMIFAILVKVLFNWLLIFGNAGCPPFGVDCTHCDGRNVACLRGCTTAIGA